MTMTSRVSRWSEYLPSDDVDARGQSPAQRCALSESKRQSSWGIGRRPSATGSITARRRPRAGSPLGKPIGQLIKTPGAAKIGGLGPSRDLVEKSRDGG
jgi:hypothetical protein